ncbi:MAG: helix-turn-helix domain-containing protein [Betaproteobacteria bacterium]|nr:helix-turn-helix domain-containing protein [Betaproteobacteria bacterium]
MTNPDPLLNKATVAQRLSCSERTLERLVRKAQFAPPLRHGKEALWFESVVTRWLAQQREQQLAWTPAAAWPAIPPGSEPQACVAQESAASTLLAVAEPRALQAPARTAPRRTTRGNHAAPSR